MQVITYYSYAKLDRAIQTFISDIREAKDDKEAEEIFTKFVGDSAPLIGKSGSGAGFFGKIKNKILGGGGSKGCSQETVEVLQRSGVSTETIGKICP